MLSRVRFTPALIAATALALPAACTWSPEDRAAKEVARINADPPSGLESAKADGKVVVVRFKPVSATGLSDDELRKMQIAALCTYGQFRQLLASGVSMRLEIPRDGDVMTIDIDHCDAA